MGGSIATKATDYFMKNYASEDWVSHIKGMFIIDVVEGSALDALPFMEQIVKNRPT
jgi:protein phosphatase methylesterase 1